MSVNGTPHSSLPGPVPKKRRLKRRARKVAAKTELNPTTYVMSNKDQSKTVASQSLAANSAVRKEAKEAARSAKKVLSKSKVFYQK
jgi:hypothetical protein